MSHHMDTGASLMEMLGLLMMLMGIITSALGHHVWCPPTCLCAGDVFPASSGPVQLLLLLLLALLVMVPNRVDLKLTVA